MTFTRQPDTRLTDLAFLKSLTGGYQLNDTKAQIVLKDGKLQILFAGQPPYDLEPYKNNSYRLKQFSDTTIEFLLPVADNLTGLKIKDGTGETTWQRLVN